MKKFSRRSHRLLAGVLALAALLSLAACQAEPNHEDGGHTADELARAAVTASGRDPDGVERLGDVLEDADIAAYVENYYGVAGDGWTDCAVYRAGGAEAFEIAVLRLKDEAGARAAADSLEQYIREREGAFVGYFPAQADIVSHSLAASQGVYAALLICEHPEAARDAFLAVLNGEEPPPPPEEERFDGPTADELAVFLLEAFDLETDSVEPLNYTLSEAEQAVIWKRIGFQSADCADYAWYGTSGRRADGRVLELYAFRMHDTLDKDDVPKLFRNAHTTEREDENGNTVYETAYLDADGNPFALPVQTVMTCGPYQFLILSNFSANDSAALEAYGTYNWSEPACQRAFHKLISHIADAGIGTYPNASAWYETEPSGGSAAEPATGRTPYVDPEKEDMTVYDTDPILAAWEKGDPSGLSEYDRATYDAAVRVLGEILTDGMTDYEKEYAIYLWTVTHIAYDYSHQDTLAVTRRDAYTPYGGLVNRKGVCLGYASSFQLLMDMAGVECITVVGASMDSTENHAWNQVRLDGEWYCVDPTWDGFPSYLTDLSPENWDESWWGFFNITSDELAFDHQWDYAGVPEATGTRYALRR